MATLAISVVDYLNDALLADHHALAALMQHRVPCNESLAKHPTIQVGDDGDGYRVGFIGLLNGLVSELSGGKYPQVVMVVDDELDIVRFEYRPLFESSTTVTCGDGSGPRWPAYVCRLCGATFCTPGGTYPRSCDACGTNEASR